jgi:hypothetical protein
MEKSRPSLFNSVFRKNIETEPPIKIYSAHHSTWASFGHTMIVNGGKVNPKTFLFIPKTVLAFLRSVEGVWTQTIAVLLRQCFLRNTGFGDKSDLRTLKAPQF